jgi:hypothetical protein
MLEAGSWKLEARSWKLTLFDFEVVGWAIFAKLAICVLAIWLDMLRKHLLQEAVELSPKLIIEAGQGDVIIGLEIAGLLQQIEMDSGFIA